MIEGCRRDSFPAPSYQATSPKINLLFTTNKQINIGAETRMKNNITVSPIKDRGFKSFIHLTEDPKAHNKVKT